MHVISPHSHFFHDARLSCGQTGSHQSSLTPSSHTENGHEHSKRDGGKRGALPDTEPEGIAKFIGVTDTCTDITIRNLKVSNLTSVLEVDGGVTVTDLLVENVHASGMVRYGFFISNRSTGTFRNCSVDDTIIEHPFRLYAHGVEPTNIGDLLVENCWSYRSGKTGLWIVEGNVARVDRFSSDKWLRIGPDNGWCGEEPDLYPCADGPLTNVFAQSLRTTDYVMVEMASTAHVS